MNKLKTISGALAILLLMFLPLTYAGGGDVVPIKPIKPHHIDPVIEEPVYHAVNSGSSRCDLMNRNSCTTETNKHYGGFYYDSEYYTARYVGINLLGTYILKIYGTDGRVYYKPTLGTGNFNIGEQKFNYVLTPENNAWGKLTVTKEI